MIAGEGFKVAGWLASVTVSPGRASLTLRNAGDEIADLASAQDIDGCRCR